MAQCHGFTTAHAWVRQLNVELGSRYALWFTASHIMQGSGVTRGISVWATTWTALESTRTTRNDHDSFTTSSIRPCYTAPLPSRCTWECQALTGPSRHVPFWQSTWTDLLLRHCFRSHRPSTEGPIVEGHWPSLRWWRFASELVHIFLRLSNPCTYCLIFS